MRTTPTRRSDQPESRGGLERDHFAEREGDQGNDPDSSRVSGRPGQAASPGGPAIGHRQRGHGGEMIRPGDHVYASRRRIRLKRRS